MFLFVVSHRLAFSLGTRLMTHSLQCPRCHGAVKVTDEQSGSRVQCPHCDESFLVPGGKRRENDDDDWLKLDDDVLPMSQAPSPTKPVPAKPGPANSAPRAPRLSDRDEELLAQFTFDDDDSLPPFQPLDQTVKPAGSATIGGGGAASPETRPTRPAAEPVTPKSARPVAGTPKLATEYRMNCPICGSMTHVRAAQAGRTIKCTDCHSPMKVPPPPKVRAEPTMDLANAETFSFGAEPVDRPADPFTRSAEQLLRDAEKNEEFEPKPDLDTPSVAEWARNVFGIFLDPGVLVHWLILSIFASIPAYVALHFESRILMMGLFPSGLFFGAIVLGCGFAILQSIANEEDRVSEWPVFDPMEWFGQMFVAVAAVALAAAPAYGLAFLVFGHNLLAVAIAMFAIYALFPFFILSMLDMQSIAAPFSPEVARSITRCEESWGGFYFSSGLLFGGLFLWFTFASTFSPPIQAVMSIFAAVAVVFIYFAMIGRLAFAIGQAVNEKPMKNDIDRSRKPNYTEERSP